MQLQNFIGKKVYCKTFSNRVYIGVVKEVEYMGENEQKKPIWLIGILTKFDEFVSINSLDLKFMEEEK